MTTPVPTGKTLAYSGSLFIDTADLPLLIVAANAKGYPADTVDLAWDFLSKTLSQQIFNDVFLEPFRAALLSFYGESQSEMIEAKIAAMIAGFKQTMTLQ